MFSLPNMEYIVNHTGWTNKNCISMKTSTKTWFKERDTRRKRIDVELVKKKLWLSWETPISKTARQLIQQTRLPTQCCNLRQSLHQQGSPSKCYSNIAHVKFTFSWITHLIHEWPKIRTIVIRTNEILNVPFYQCCIMTSSLDRMRQSNP